MSVCVLMLHVFVFAARALLQSQEEELANLQEAFNAERNAIKGALPTNALGVRDWLPYATCQMPQAEPSRVSSFPSREYAPHA